MARKFHQQQRLAAALSATAEPLKAAGDGSSERDSRVEGTEAPREVAELRAARAALDVARRRYSELFDLAPVACLTLDVDGRIDELNAAAAALLGRERPHLLGTLLSASARPVDLDAFSSHFRRCLEGAEQTSGEVALSPRETGPLAIQLVSAPVRDSAGRIVGCRTALVDVTLRRHAEDAARFGVELGLALDETLDPVAVLARAARALVPLLADVCVVHVVAGADRPARTSAFCADGAGAVEAAGLAQVFPDVAGFAAPVDAAMATRTVQSIAELGAPRAGGRSGADGRGELARVPELRSLLVAPLLARGRCLGVVAMASAKRSYGSADAALAGDLGRRIGLSIDNAHLHEQALSAVRGRDDMLAIVSHDLRNSVHIVSMAARQLLMSVNDRVLPTTAQLHRILRAGEAMGRLVGDLLDVALLETGHLALDRRLYRAIDLLKETVDALHPASVKRSVRLELDGPDDLLVLADRERAYRVLGNLVGNAIKLCRERGSVSVTVEPRDGYALFSVSDEGPGIPQADLPRVFDAYWRGQAGHRGSGAGLGLAIAKWVVEAHGGSIWAKSRAGSGSTFHFTLPAGRAPAHSSGGSFG